MTSLLAFLGMGGTEMIIVFVAVLLLFGPKKLPELARGLGKGIREFKKASNEVTEELQRAVDEPSAPVNKFPPEGAPVERPAVTPKPPAETSVPRTEDQPKPPL